MAMFELNWASFEPRPGVVCASYLATMRSYLRAYQAAGQRVTLGLGLQNPPSWVFSLPGSTYVDQNGGVSTQAGFVFSQAVRQAAASYLSLVAAALPLSACWAIRLTSGGDGEMLYPPGGTYWAFSQAALTGTGLADGMAPNPYPTWRPGRPGPDRPVGQLVRRRPGQRDQLADAHPVPARLRRLLPGRHPWIRHPAR